MRLATGGMIDRSRPLTFRWNGTTYMGFAGDSLASALLASGPRVLSRSVQLGRPRGLYAAGTEEPNSYAQVLIAGVAEPMLRTTRVELFDGLDATSLNGKGRVPATTDSALYDKMFAHCDVLVVGGGPAGLAAAQAAGATDARVILVDEQPELGGSLLGARASVGGRPATEWLEGHLTRLRAMPETRILTRATAFGYYEANCVLVVQQFPPGAGAPHQRLWQVRAKRVVLATGAFERPLVFADNDRPGVMLAGAILTYLNRFAVVAGERIALFANNDSVYGVAHGLVEAGVAVAAIVDTRAQPGRLAEAARGRGVEVLAGHAVVGTDGDPELTAVRIQALAPDGSATGSVRRLACDVLGVSGGFNPVLHLFSQSGGRPRFDEQRVCFVPGASTQSQEVVGAAAGDFWLDDGALPLHVEPRWLMPAPDGDWTAHFVDLERDVTVAALQRGVGAGLRSIEHLKRYTSFGTGSDQGKTSGVLAAGIAGELLGDPLATLGTTSARPPYIPVAFGLLAGPNRGALYDPIRVTPMHPWHVANGAVFEDVGQWRRPRYFPRAGEDMGAAVVRECRAARQGVGVIDASTLGKIELQGPDAAELLNRLYTNRFDNLAVGSIRYGVMCRADGMILDDGVVMRLAADRFLATTTTGNAADVLEWMEEWLQTEWPTLRVRLTSVTDQWATIAVVGPRARDVLRPLAQDIAIDAERFPFMQLREGTVAGVAARVCRVTYSGELAFEVHVPAWYGLAVWQAVIAAGRGLGITPYGTETMHVLRAEKGYIVVGQDTDGTVTPIDAGLGWLVSQRKADFIGRRSLARADTARADRKHLVGLLPHDPAELLPEGAPLVLGRDDPLPGRTYGHVTSSYYSAALGRTFALALLAGGRQRLGATVYAPLPDRVVAATVTETVFYDRENRRRDG